MKNNRITRWNYMSTYIRVCYTASSSDFHSSIRLYERCLILTCLTSVENTTVHPAEILSQRGCLFSLRVCSSTIFNNLTNSVFKSCHRTSILSEYCPTSFPNIVSLIVHLKWLRQMTVFKWFSLQECKFVIRNSSLVYSTNLE